MDIFDKDNLEKLLWLFNSKKKRETIKYCKDLVITSEGFTSLLLAGKTKVTAPYYYKCQFRDFVPEHLPPSKKELDALGNNGVGKLEGKAKKAVTKLSQIFEDRRLFAAHLFHTSSYKYWHMFYFDQRDTLKLNNHWGRGPHIHYSSDLIAQGELPEIWKQICHGKPKPPKSIHIKFDYHHNRDDR